MLDSLSGKWTRQWILDNKLMRAQALKWMQTTIKDGATKDHGVFCISDFQNYLNNKLLPEWKVPKSTLPHRAHSQGEVSEFLQVSWSTARSWAVALGAKYKKLTKGYYVDGHDRPDVLEHRKEWLSKELQLELRQYLWAQLTIEQAASLDIPGCQAQCSPSAQPPSAQPSTAPSTVKPHKFNRLSAAKTMKREPKALTPEQKEENDRMRQHCEHEVVYRYTTPQGHDMVEVHVDLIPQALRKQLSKKLKIHDIEVDMGGNLSVRFPAGKDPIIKVGTDEVIFKVTLHTCMFLQIYYYAYIHTLTHVSADVQHEQGDLGVGRTNQAAPQN